MTHTVDVLTGMLLVSRFRNVEEHAIVVFHHYGSLVLFFLDVNSSLSRKIIVW